MFGKDKSQLRIKAMNKMMRDKPSMEMKPMGEEMEMASDEMGEKGMISMPVTEEEKMMILSLRKEKDGGMEMEESEEYA